MNLGRETEKIEFKKTVSELKEVRIITVFYGSIDIEKRLLQRL